MLSTTVLLTVAVVNPVKPIAVIFHAVYRDYAAKLLEVNPDTKRARILMEDDILGYERLMYVDSRRIEVL